MTEATLKTSTKLDALSMLCKLTGHEPRFEYKKGVLHVLSLRHREPRKNHFLMKIKDENIVDRAVNALLKELPE